MKKPLSVKWMIGILIARIGLYLLLIVAYSIIFFVETDNEFIIGMRRGIGFDGSVDNSTYLLGYIAGGMAWTFILSVLQIVFIHYRKRIGFWVVFGIDALFTIGSFSLPLVGIVVFILGLQKNAKAYMAKKEYQKSDEDVLDSSLVG